MSLGGTRWRIALALGAALASLAGPARSQPEPHDRRAAQGVARERHLGVMGTDLHVRALGTDADELDGALEAAIAELQRVEDLMTDWRPSPLMDVNAAAGQGPRRTDVELAAIISRGLELGRLSRGAFDISYAGVGHLWDFKSVPPVVPDAAAIERALPSVGFHRIHVDANKSTVDLPAGMKIGLGGIAKGYGVDRAMTVLRKRGVEHAIVNAGGDLKVLGRDGEEPWVLAVKHPRDRERVIAVLRLSNVAFATSGDYERFFERGGERYHHIIDPRTGYPSVGSISASVVAPSAELADALATALCVLGPAEGLPIIEGIDRVEAIVVGMEGDVHASTGLREALREQAVSTRESPSDE
jgi:thiamine biosynthesis lipoprotein